MSGGNFDYRKSCLGNIIIQLINDIACHGII